MGAPNRCPACRARFSEETPLEEPCRRCKADLSLYRKCYIDADRLKSQARLALKNDNPFDALRSALSARLLVDDEETRLLLASCLFASGDETGAIKLLNPTA